MGDQPSKLKEVVDMLVRKPVNARLRERMKELQKLSRAVTSAIPYGNNREHETVGPQMHIMNLSGRMINGKGEISYYKYKMDANGNKAVNVTQVPHPITGKPTDINSSPMIDSVVVETIEFLKPIQVTEKKY